MRIELDKLKKQVVVAKKKSVENKTEKTDLEHLFVNCIEDVRKDIIRRRLKAEVQARKKGSTINNSSTLQSLH